MTVGQLKQKYSEVSGFDTFLIEGYQYPGINHNLDQASRCAQYPWKELARARPTAVT